MAREAVAWMERNKDRPFFLNYWQFSVHAPFDAKKALIENHRARVNPNDAQRSPTYAAMIESMDDAVGTLLAAIDRLCIYLHDYATVRALEEGLAAFFAFYHEERLHAALDYLTPAAIYKAA